MLRRTPSYPFRKPRDLSVVGQFEFDRLWRSWDDRPCINGQATLT